MELSKGGYLELKMVSSRDTSLGRLGTRIPCTTSGVGGLRAPHLLRVFALLGYMRYNPNP